MKGGLNAAQKALLSNETKSYLGLPYDYQMMPDDSAMYCSELVNKVYERSLGICLGKWLPLGLMNWLPYLPVIISIAGKLPLRRMIVSPVSIFKDTRLDIFTLE